MDTDFTDDIALLSDNIEDAQTLLTLVVNAENTVGLNVNEDKTKYMSYNIPGNTELTANGKPLKKVLDFKYLGSWVDNSAKDIKVRTARTWTAKLKLDNIWKSNLPRRLDQLLNFFRATVESILLYGAETCTMTKELDGTYTRLLRQTLNINCDRQEVKSPAIRQPLRLRFVSLMTDTWRVKRCIIIITHHERGALR